LLELVFAKEGRPSLRMLRNLQKRGVVPFYKIGRLVLFDPAEAREALGAKCRVLADTRPTCHLGDMRLAGVSATSGTNPNPGNTRS
ncbi:MAG: hypothetical protein ABIZ04_21655, partial [Opitutus sp.]